MHSFITRSLAIAALTLAVVALWSKAVRAETYLETDCRRVALTQSAAPGEQVTVCELRRVASTVTTATTTSKVASAKPKARTGRTVVTARLGARRSAPTAALVMPPLTVRAHTPSALRTAALDVDGTCGGLPAVCCDWRTGSRALCGRSAF